MFKVGNSLEIAVRAITEDSEVLNRCRVTVWKDEIEKIPSERFMRDIYISEHSPIRDKWFVISIRGVKSWLATHFVRHSVGYTPYVSTQRDDRLEYSESRDERKQGELVNMDITLNAQAFINVSKNRLCGQAHPEAQVLWSKVLSELHEVDEPLFSVCVPTCVSKGFCPELHPCGRTESITYKEMRKKYIGDRPIIEF